MVPLARGKGAAEEAAAEEAEEDAMPERKRLRRLTLIVMVIDRVMVIVMVIDRMTVIDRMMVNDWTMVIMIVIMMAIECDCDKIL